MKKRLIVAAVFCVFHNALAEETVRATTPSNNRFFPLDDARAGRRNNAQEKQLRSDSGAMSNGYFRIDRSRTVPMSGPLVIRPSGSNDDVMPRIIRGTPAPAAPVPKDAAFLPADAAASPETASVPLPTNGDPVLSLFNAQSNMPASFRDALARKGQQTNLGAHQWPIAPTANQKVSSNYGFRSDPFDKQTKFHGGMDIAAPIGTPVLATADGTVESVETDGGYGKTIILSHADGSQSRYSHLSSQTVSVGQQVKSGQTIGAVGNSGHSTGAHLDYRLTQDGVSIDPMKTLSKQNAIATVPSAQIEVKRPAYQPRTDRLIVVKE